MDFRTLRDPVDTTLPLGPDLPGFIERLFVMNERTGETGVPMVGPSALAEAGLHYLLRQ